VLLSIAWPARISGWRNKTAFVVATFTAITAEIHCVKTLGIKAPDAPIPESSKRLWRARGNAKAACQRTSRAYFSPERRNRRPEIRAIASAVKRKTSGRALPEVSEV
jgi:hypothetical protein